MANLEWEEVGDVHRIRVPGGWLVKDGYYEAVGICFYPDPEHKWLG